VDTISCSNRERRRAKFTKLSNPFRPSTSLIHRGRQGASTKTLPSARTWERFKGKGETQTGKGEKGKQSSRCPSFAAQANTINSIFGALTTANNGGIAIAKPPEFEQRREKN